MKGISSDARAIFAENLRRTMKGRGIEQADIVARLGITASTVSDWTNGKKYPRVDAMQRLADVLGVEMHELVTDRSTIPNTYPVGSLAPVRVAGVVRAGYNGIALEEFLGYEYCDVKHPENYFYLRVVGDSMSPAINEGELALVRIQDDVESGQIAVVVIDGEEGTIKKVIKNGSAVVLQPFNSAYEARIYAGKELDEVRIVGLVMETKRKWA